MTPKIIHYCWLSNSPIPKKLKKYINNWKIILPDYQFILWNFEKFPIEQSQWVKEAFTCKKYAFAADYIRLYALYNYGGIYLDTDVEILKSFNDLLHLDLIIGYENSYIFNHKKLEMATIGSSKNNKFIKECLSFYENKHFINEDGTYNMIPIPNIIEECIKNKYTLQPTTTIPTNMPEDEHIIPVLPEAYFSPKSYLTGEVFVTPQTHSIHHFRGSWQSPWKKFKLYVRRLFKIKKIF